MYHYLFTNDLRISGLDVSLRNAGECFKNNTVPSASEDKSANNNMKTLGFYFNLTESSRCSDLASMGNIRAVVLNFIKKFQFPNLRTIESFNATKEDGIIIAPMRVIIKVLYMMNLIHGGTNAYLKREEIKLFIFFNSAVAKTKNPDIVSLIKCIFEYRSSGIIPDTVDADTNHHVWNQEDRQLREMIKVLVWSGCVVEDEDKISIKNENLSRENKADIFDIINCTSYWEGTTRESYVSYMDISEVEKSEWEYLESSSTDPEVKHGASNILLYGVPGAGKSHTIKERYCSNEAFLERVVFHPDYTYSDFVGQILPRVDESGKLEYVFTPGPFTKILKKAVIDPTNYYYFIIEELNRGNAPAIFGEIFQLLDRIDSDGAKSKNEIGESEYGITNYDVARIVYGDPEHPVKIPSNLYILATMNTADQNVFTLDTAFQRRWDMQQIKNRFDRSEHSMDRIHGTNVSWGAFATTINDIIIESNQDIASSEDKRLGTYFAKKSELETKRFPEKVLKYLWDDAFKMEKTSVFKDNYRSLEEVIISYEQSGVDKLQTVLRAEVYRKMLEKMDIYTDKESSDDDLDKEN